MERILIVEDNKTLAKLIAKKLSEVLDFEVDIAFNLAETKLFLHKYKYFTTILDINLPDAPNGEVIDYVLNKKQSAIVLSSRIDKKFRHDIFKKNIIDYVNKVGINDINYIIQTIQRLQKNKKHKVLVVDDSRVFRKQMTDFLEIFFYKVIAVAHGEEAVAMIEANPDLSLVITDYNMPVMDGLELTLEIRKRYTKNEICILALSANDNEDVSALFLKKGANDFIKKPFSKEEFSCRVNNSIEALENIQTITNQAQRDFMTGLYNRRYFFESMRSSLAENRNEFFIAMVDIDNFKKINDAYGHDTGDKVIIKLSQILLSETNHNDLVSRFGGEEFCIVLKDLDTDGVMIALDRIRQEVEQNTMYSDKKEMIKFTVSIGVSLFNHEDTLDEVINQADMKLYTAKHSGKNQVQI